MRIRPANLRRALTRTAAALLMGIVSGCGQLMVERADPTIERATVDRDAVRVETLDIDNDQRHRGAATRTGPTARTTLAAGAGATTTATIVQQQPATATATATGTTGQSF